INPNKFSPGNTTPLNNNNNNNNNNKQINKYNSLFTPISYSPSYDENALDNLDDSINNIPPPLQKYTPIYNWFNQCIRNNDEWPDDLESEFDSNKQFSLSSLNTPQIEQLHYDNTY